MKTKQLTSIDLIAQKIEKNDKRISELRLKQTELDSELYKALRDIILKKRLIQKSEAVFDLEFEVYDGVAFPKLITSDPSHWSEIKKLIREHIGFNSLQIWENITIQLHMTGDYVSIEPILFGNHGSKTVLDFAKKFKLKINQDNLDEKIEYFANFVKIMSEFKENQKDRCNEN